MLTVFFAGFSVSVCMRFSSASCSCLKRCSFKIWNPLSRICHFVMDWQLLRPNPAFALTAETGYSRLCKQVHSMGACCLRESHGAGAHHSWRRGKPWTGWQLISELRLIKCLSNCLNSWLCDRRPTVCKTERLYVCESGQPQRSTSGDGAFPVSPQGFEYSSLSICRNTFRLYS